MWAYLMRKMTCYLFGKEKYIHNFVGEKKLFFIKLIPHFFTHKNWSPGTYKNFIIFYLVLKYKYQNFIYKSYDPLQSNSCIRIDKVALKFF